MVNKYMSTTDEWEHVMDLPAAAVPHGSGICMTVAVGSNIYVFCDGSSVGHQFNTVEAIILPIADKPIRTFGSTMCVVGTDIYVFGGRNGDPRPIAQVMKYDTLCDMWSILDTSMPVESPNDVFTACEMGGLVYIVGAGTSHKEVLRFHPASGEWSRLVSTSSAKLRAAVFVLKDQLYATGATVRGGGREITECYDVVADTWTELAPMAQGRNFRVATITSTFMRPVDELNFFDQLIDSTGENE
jgi:hypothetical protein